MKYDFKLKTQRQIIHKNTMSYEYMSPLYSIMKSLLFWRLWKI